MTESPDDTQARIENAADETVWDVAERCQYEGRARKETWLGVQEMAVKLLAIRNAVAELRSAQGRHEGRLNDAIRKVRALTEDA